MNIFYKSNKCELYLGDCLDVLKTFQSDNVEAIVTDLPAGISFMGKEWDMFDKSMFGKKGEEGLNDLKIKKDFELLPRYGSNIRMVQFYRYRERGRLS